MQTNEFAIIKIVEITKQGNTASRNTIGIALTLCSNMEKLVGVV